MKVNYGSIQRKGARLYLVIYSQGRHKWISLKTNDMAKARQRARQIVSIPAGESEWLAHLADMGRAANRKLLKMRGDDAPGWDEIMRRYLTRTGRGTADGGNYTYERWLFLLKKAAGGISPDALDANSANRAISSLAEQYVSCRRMVGFFRRCWLVVGLDASIWEMNATLKQCVNERGKAQEFYRRLTIDEVRRLYRHLRETSPDLADFVAIGFFTGLRLSDIAELEVGEIANDGVSLRIIPNKTRRIKDRPLSIPLIYEAADIVSRRSAWARSQTAASPENASFLFPPAMRNRPTRQLAVAFSACGMRKRGEARASFHSLRATFISMMDEAGIPPHLTDAITGHGGGGMHARYTQPSLDALRAAMTKALPPISPPQQ